jgi:hypothetical protein
MRILQNHLRTKEDIMAIKDPVKHERSSRNIRLVMIGLLSIEYILGMINNLYVQFPETGTEAQMWEFAWKQISVGAHIILGIILLLAGLFIFIRAIRDGNRTITIVSGIGFIAILVAGFSGAMFIPAQMDLYSLSMSIAFLVALLCYVWFTFV